jgi:hypothetical protein
MPRNEYILLIPWFDRLDFPYPPANVIAANVTPVVKKLLPVGRPLAIDMVLAWLPGASGGKNDHVRVARQSIHKGSCMPLVEVFRHFETKHRVKSATQIPRACEVTHLKAITWDEKLPRRYCHAVNAHEFLDSSLNCGLEPRPSAATDVHETV